MMEVIMNITVSNRNQTIIDGTHKGAESLLDGSWKHCIT